MNLHDWIETHVSGLSFVDITMLAIAWVMIVGSCIGLALVVGRVIG